MLLVDFRCDYLKYTMVISYFLLPIPYSLFPYCLFPIAMIRLEAYTERSESNPGHSLGIYKMIKRKLSGRQYLIYAWIRYCLPDSCIYVFLYPETLSRVTLASLGIGFQTNIAAIIIECINKTTRIKHQ